MRSRLAQGLAALLLLSASETIAAESEEEQVPSLPPAQASAICDEVVRLTNQGQIQDRLLKFNPPSHQEQETVSSLKPIGGVSLQTLSQYAMPDGSKRRFATVTGGGSCTGNYIIDYDAAVSSGEVDLSFVGIDTEDDDVLRWARWGMIDHFLVIREQPIIIAANFFASPTRVRLASWLGPDGQTPLCAFRASGTVALKAPPDAPPVCHAVAAGKISVVPWQPVTQPKASVTGRPHGRGGLPVLVATATADLDGDGNPDRIGLERLDSGAGCGSSRNFLSHLREDGTTVPQNPLSHALGTESWGPTYPDKIKTPQGALSLFRYHGRTYILGKHKGQTGVFSVEGDQIRQSCSLDVRPQIEVEKAYISPSQ